MKSKALVIIATLFVFVLVSTANAGSVQSTNQASSKPGTKGIDITLKQAMSDLALVAAIYQQVSITQVLNSPSVIYTATIIYQNNVIEVTGVHDQWILFFKMNTASRSPFTVHPIPIK